MGLFGWGAVEGVRGVRGVRGMEVMGLDVLFILFSVLFSLFQSVSVLFVGQINFLDWKWFENK
jgi:hypothetical protein